jgi:hypothetical protein
VNEGRTRRAASTPSPFPRGPRGRKPRKGATQ